MKAAALIAMALLGACSKSSPAPDGGTGGTGGAAGSAPDSASGGSGGTIPDARVPDVLTPDARPSDASRDVVAPDTGPVAAECPGPGAYVGNAAWKNAVQASASASVCVPQSFGRTLKEAQRAKAMLRIAPGRYPILDSPGPAPFALPVCLLRAGLEPLAAGTGTIKGVATGRGARYDFSQPLTGETATLGGTFAGTEPFTVSFDSQGSDPIISLLLCPRGDCLDVRVSHFDDCAYEGVPPTIHKVTLEGGSVDLELRIDRGGISVGNEPAAFVRANGTFQGVAFDQRDYFKLIYTPAVNHHFVRDFAVLFDAPIGGACGLEVSGINRMMPAPVAFAVDCVLERLRPVPILGIR